MSQSADQNLGMEPTPPQQGQRIFSEALKMVSVADSSRSRTVSGSRVVNFGTAENFS
jgi:hypothetical protein